MEKERIYSIDSMRFIAVCGVILAHCMYIMDVRTIYVDQTLRFIIPFFCATSGYFLTQKLMASDSSKVYLKYSFRILSIYIFWSLLYIIEPDFATIKQVGLIKSYELKMIYFKELGIEKLIFEGVRYHLWFLISLFFTILVFMLFRLKRIKLFIAVSAILYVVGALGNVYKNTPIGFDAHFDTQNFIFFTALPFSLGVYIRLINFKMEPWIALAIYVIGTVLQISEWYMLEDYLPYKYPPYLLSTIIMGMGMFLFVLNDRKILNSKRLANLGKLTLGIYAGHLLIARRLKPVDIGIVKSYWVIIYPVTVIILTSIMVLVLKRIKILSRFV